MSWDARLDSELVSASTSESSDKSPSESLATLTVASSFVAIVLGAIFWLSRIGFANPWAPVIKCVGLALLYVNAPYLVWWRSRAKEQEWFRSYPFLWLVIFTVIAATGRIQIETGIAFSMAITALGILSALASFALWTRFATVKRLLILMIGSGFFATWAGGVVWGRIYKSPLFFETMITTGIVHHDGVTLAALGNMLRTYHAASMGLDGVTPYMAYHWGTPWLFAQLSNLTDISVLEFYQLGYPVVFVPLFFGGILMFGAIIRSLLGSMRIAVADPLYWIAFIAATIGIMPIAGMDAVGVWTSNLTISESYAVAMPVGLMLLAATMIFWKSRGDSLLSRASLSDYAFVAIIVPAGLVALGYLKISLMILGFGAAGYAALRVRAWRRPVLLVIGIAITALIYLTYKRVSLVAHHEGIAPLDFVRGFVPPVWWQFFVLFQLFWSLVYIVLRLRKEGARTVRDVILLIRERRILDVEVLAIIAIAGIIPGMILHIDGGSAFYFSDIQRWVAVGLLLAWLPLLITGPSRVDWSDLRVIAIAFVALPLAVSTLRNSAHWTTEMLKANAALRATLYTDAGVPAAGSLRALPHLTDKRILSHGLFESPSYNAVVGLMKLDFTPIYEKRKTLVFVPQSDSVYWHILKRSNSCGFSSFVVPSLTGMAMVDGMPPYGCRLSPYYGLSLFERRTRPQTAQDADPRVLCTRARKLGFSQVLSLHFSESGDITSELSQCSS